MKSSKSFARAFVAAVVVANSVASWLAMPCYAERRPLSVPVVNSSPRPAVQPEWNEIYGKLPLSFEANQGQFDLRVRFASRTQGQTIYLTSTEAVLCLNSPGVEGELQATDIASEPTIQKNDIRRSPATVVRMKLVGACIVTWW